MGNRTITPDKVDEIIACRSRMLSERDTAAQVGVAQNTVRKHWRAHLDSLAVSRAANLDGDRVEMSVRLSAMMLYAWRRAQDDEKDGARWGGVALKAAAQLAQINGFNAPTEWAVAVEVRTSDEARAMLSKLTVKERARLGL